MDTLIVSVDISVLFLFYFFIFLCFKFIVCVCLCKFALHDFIINKYDILQLITEHNVVQQDTDPVSYEFQLRQ